MTRRFLPIFLILIGGWGLLEALSFHAGLGEYAKSPQRIQLSQGMTSLVAGGQAGLVFMEDRFRKKAQLLVRCKEGRTAINLRPGQISELVCGVTVELLEILPAGKVNVVVRWGEDAVAPNAEGAERKTQDSDATGSDAVDPRSTGGDSTERPVEDRNLENGAEAARPTPPAPGEDATSSPSTTPSS